MVVFGCCTCLMVIHVCCKSLLKMFHLFQTHVASVLSGCCICCNGYVTNICSKCFICFRHMLQLFHLSVTKVDMDVGLLSKEESSSAGAMAVSMWGGGAGHTMSVWKRQGSHLSSVEEVGVKQCGRGGRGASVEEMGPSHRGGVGGGAEGSGPNAGAGSGAGVGGE
jgi:hypothetical protein